MTIAPARRGAVLFGVALLVRLCYVTFYPPLPLAADARDYDVLATNIRTGRGFVDEAGRPESLRAPLYPYVVAAIECLPGAGPATVRTVQALLGAVVPLLTFSLARRPFGERVAWIAAAAAAVYPALVAYCGLLLTETLATVLALLIALTTSALWRERTLPRTLVAGAILGLAVLCRAEWITVALAFMALFALVPSRPSPGPPWTRLDLATPVLLVLTLAAVLSPWMVRNHRVLGGVVPVTTDGWRTLWIATYPEGWLEWKREEPLLSIEGPPDTPPLERARRFRAAALANLRQAPLAYVRMCTRRVVLLWIGGHGNAIAGLEGSTRSSRGAVLAVKVALLALNTSVVLLGLAGLVMSRARWRERAPLMTCILVPAATYVLLFAVPRYHVPLLPLLFPFAVEALLAGRTPGERARAFHAADVRVTDRLLSRTPLHPAFWVYRRIRGAVAAAARAHGRGVLLDVGCGAKPYEDAFAGRVSRHVGLEPSPSAGYAGNRADLAADAAALPFTAASCDTVLCTEVLEHVRKPAAVVAEIARVLRPGGVAIVTVPFVYPVHDRHDYQRFTAAGLRELFEGEGFEVVEVRPLSYPAMTLAIMAALVVHDLLFVRNRYGYALSLPLRPALWAVVAALNLAGLLGEPLCRATSFPFGHSLVARRAP